MFYMQLSFFGRGRDGLCFIVNEMGKIMHYLKVMRNQPCVCVHKIGTRIICYLKRIVFVERVRYGTYFLEEINGRVYRQKGKWQEKINFSGICAFHLTR